MVAHVTADHLPTPHAFARRIVDQLNANGYTPPTLDRLVQWVAWAHDTRWLEVHVTVDGATGDPIYAVEAHTLDLCPTRDCRVDHVYHGAGRNLIDAATCTLQRIEAA